jgi:hypothetical protein
VNDLLERAEAAIKVLGECRDGLAAEIVKMRANDDPELNRWLAAAHDAGFTLDELGGLLGLTRERIRQRIEQGVVQPRPRVELTPAEAQRLRELHALSDGRKPGRTQDVLAYRTFLSELVDAGVTRTTIAAALGLSHGAIRSQLKRVASDDE